MARIKRKTDNFLIPIRILSCENIDWCVLFNCGEVICWCVVLQQFLLEHGEAERASAILEAGDKFLLTEMAVEEFS